MIHSQQEILEMEIIKDKFLNMTTHPYLKKYIKKPDIDYDMILFLLEIMNDSKLSSEEKQDQIIAVLLVQQAFLVHEEVRNTVLSDEVEKKTRQLAVLAGDFFSSLYYSILVKKAHHGLLAVFTYSIQKINEEKLSLHFFNGGSEEELLARLRSLEGVLIAEIASYYGVEELGYLAEDFFFLKRLEQERQEEEEKHLSSFAAAVHTFMEGERTTKGTVESWPPKNTKIFLDDKINEQKEQLSQHLKADFSFYYVSLQQKLYERICTEQAEKIR